MTRSALLAAALLIIPSAALASGFQVNEQSARGLGRAFAGEVARGGDASALWFNPALAIDQETATVTGSVAGVFSTGALRNRGTTLTGPGTLGRPAPVGGPDGSDPLEPAAVPQASAVVPLGRDWRAGLSVNAPFGLVVDYGPSVFSRYDSTRTELLTLNVQASLTRRLGRAVSVGVGVSAQYADATLESALPNLGPGASDGLLRIEGDDWTAGWNLGAAWTPRPGVRIGAHYRSAIRHELEGEQVIRGLAGPLAAANRTSPGLARLDVPDIASIGASVDVSDRVAFVAQVDRLGWSRFEEIRVRSPGGPDLVRPQNYEDTVSVALGAEWRARDDLVARAGVRLEETPTVQGFRSSRVPDAPRRWLAVGASWTPRDTLTLDAGLAYVSLEDARVTREDLLYEGTPLATRLALESEIEGDATILSLGGSWRF